MSDFGNRDGGFRPQRTFAPVKVGDELDVKIEAVGEKGDGIAKKNGFVLFVPNTREGDEVKIRVTRVLRKVGFAEVVGPGSAPKSEDSQGSEQSDSGYAQDEAAEESETQEESTEESSEDSEDFGEEK